jgi:uncharacterized protein with HEPN domain
MTQRDLRGYPRDILDAASTIREHVGKMSFAEFERSVLVQDAVERRFAIIGEALNRAVQLDGSLAERISDVRQIVAFRNRLIHVYSDIDPQIVWDALHDHLPALARDVERALRHLDR